MRLFVILAVIFLSSVSASAQQADIINNYIASYRHIAIEEMKRTGVPASIKLAQGIHETMAGQSDLVLRSNNHFGIKCKSSWKGESVSHTDDAPNECFRKYPNPDDSYRDHSDFLKTNQRYAFLFTLDPEDYQGWAHGLKKAGYATNPKYPAIIIRLVEEYNLQQYSLIAMGKIADDKAWVKTTTAGSNELLQVPAVKQEKMPASVTAINQYPETVFKINGTRVLYAKKGTPYLTVAQQYDIPLSKLFEYNDQDQPSEAVPFDQLIFLQKKRKTGNQDFHLVAAGETLYDISQMQAIRLQSLLEFNFLSPGMEPAPGEKIYLKSKAPAAPRTIVTNNLGNRETTSFTNSYNGNEEINQTSFVHRVQPKEGLYAISRQYSVTVDELKQWNNLQSDILQVGQQIKIQK